MKCATAAPAPITSHTAAACNHQAVILKLTNPKQIICNNNAIKETIINLIRLVAVGTAVVCRPPHRSVRAELPHTALATGSDAKALRQVRVKHPNRWHKVSRQLIESSPWHTSALTAAQKREAPGAAHLAPKAGQPDSRTAGVCCREQRGN